MTKKFGLAVRVLLKDQQNRILFIRRSKESKTNPGKWEFPGGKVDDGETFDEALIREVFEETGLKISLNDPIGVAKQYLPHINAVHLIMTGEIEDGDLVLSHEHDDFKWVLKEDLETIELADWIKPVLEILIQKDNITFRFN